MIMHKIYTVSCEVDRTGWYFMLANFLFARHINGGDMGDYVTTAPSLRADSSNKHKIASSHFCTPVFESWKPKFGRGVFMARRKNE